MAPKGLWSKRYKRPTARVRVVELFHVLRRFPDKFIDGGSGRGRCHSAGVNSHSNANTGLGSRAHLYSRTELLPAIAGAVAPSVRSVFYIP